MDGLDESERTKMGFPGQARYCFHTDNDHAICLELKLESIESGYPAVGSEKEILGHRNLYGRQGEFTFPMHETALQQFLMTRLLGIESQCWLITCGDSAKVLPGIRHISWSNPLEALDPLPANLPEYMRKALERARHGLVSDEE